MDSFPSFFSSVFFPLAWLDAENFDHETFSVAPVGLDDLFIFPFGTSQLARS